MMVRLKTQHRTQVHNFLHSKALNSFIYVSSSSYILHSSQSLSSDKPHVFRHHVLSIRDAFFFATLCGQTTLISPFADDHIKRQWPVWLKMSAMFLLRLFLVRKHALRGAVIMYTAKKIMINDCTNKIEYNYLHESSSVSYKI